MQSTLFIHMSLYNVKFYSESNYIKEYCKVFRETERSSPVLAKP